MWFCTCWNDLKSMPKHFKEQAKRFGQLSQRTSLLSKSLHHQEHAHTQCLCVSSSLLGSQKLTEQKKLHVAAQSTTLGIPAIATTPLCDLPAHQTTISCKGCASPPQSATFELLVSIPMNHLAKVCALDRPSGAGKGGQKPTSGEDLALQHQKLLATRKPRLHFPKFATALRSRLGFQIPSKIRSKRKQNSKKHLNQLQTEHLRPLSCLVLDKAGLQAEQGNHDICANWLEPPLGIERRANFSIVAVTDLLQGPTAEFGKTYLGCAHLCDLADPRLLLHEPDHAFQAYVCGRCIDKRDAQKDPPQQKQVIRNHGKNHPEANHALSWRDPQNVWHMSR